VEVSSIGSVADRSEMPSDFGNARSAKWSVLVPREPRQVEDDQEVDLALVPPAEGREPLQLGAVCRLRAFTLFLEAREDTSPSRRQYSSQARSCVGRLRFSVCSLVLTRM
jgi:hypothetical protein